MARDYGTKANDLSNLNLFSCFCIRAAWSSHLGVSPTGAGFLFKSTRPVWHEKQCFRWANRLLHAIRCAKPQSLLLLLHKGGVAVPPWSLPPPWRNFCSSPTRPVWHEKQCFQWANRLLHATKREKPGACFCFYIRAAWSSHLGVSPTVAGFLFKSDPSRLARKTVLSVDKPASPRHQARKAWSLLLLLHKGGVVVPPWSLPHRGGISVQADPSRLARKAVLSVGKPASPRHQARKASEPAFAFA